MLLWMIHNGLLLTNPIQKKKLTIAYSFYILNNIQVNKEKSELPRIIIDCPKSLVYIKIKDLNLGFSNDFFIYKLIKSVKVINKLFERDVGKKKQKGQKTKKKKKNKNKKKKFLKIK